MAISARHLVEHTELGLSLVAGQQNADRAISWAHAIELADPTPYLAGGELVMTTGINIGRTDSDQYEYISRLCGAGTSAIAIDTGTTFADVPAGIIIAGNELGMPVLKVPAATPFIAITRVVIDDLTADQVRSVQRVVDQQEAMARETLVAGTPGVVRVLAQGLRTSVIVLGGDGRLLAECGPDSRRLIDTGHDIVGHGRSGRRLSSRVVPADGGYCTLQTLKVAQVLRGYLLVWSQEPLTALDRLLVAHAVSLISIELEKPAKVVDAEQRLRGAATGELVLGHGGIDSGVLRYFGFDPGSDVIVGVLKDVGPLMAAERAVNDALAETGPYLMHAAGDEVIVVIGADSHERFGALHDDLSTHLKRRVQGGLSRSGDLTSAPMLCAQARAAAQVADGKVSAFGDLGIFGIILGTRKAAELRLIAAPLAALEGDDGVLIGTLETVLANNGQIEPAATALGVHRHTLRNRLQRISKLMGIDLQSADTRAHLWVSLKARELLAIRGENVSSG